MLKHSRILRSRAARKEGFTLIELLMVIAVILVLAGITFGISRGVQNAQARAKAKAELAVIAQGLEQFKSAHGDYPATQDSSEMARALMGWFVFGLNASDEPVFTEFSGTVPINGPRSFIDPTKLSTPAGSVPSDPATRPTGTLAFQDPWGNNYVYLYKNGASDTNWDNFGYVLYSKGGDGADTPPGNDGVIDSSNRETPNNIDNIYAGE
jgi:prepilin-type N-terminal cleavage/methylation domain-containing protein